MEAGLETSNMSAEVALTTEDGQRINFASLDQMAEWMIGAQGLVNGARADEAYGKLQGIRRKVAYAITNEFRRQIAERGNASAAESFPEDVLFGGQWVIDVRKLDDEEHVQVTIEQHIKALITSIAECFALAQQKTA